MRTDGKYVVSGTITKKDGKPIPEDEPLIIFRAQDNLLVPTLEHYLRRCREAGSPQDQTIELAKRIEEIKAWQAAHPDRVKVPD